MSTARNISWVKLTAEGAAIVVSILLAFGIDAWWDERQERMEEQRILTGLEEEFSVIHEVLSSHRDLHLTRLASLGALLSAIDKDTSSVTPALLSAALDELLAPTTSDISNGTLHALLGSGRLEILSNRALRKKLVDWESAIGEVWDDQQAHSKLVHEQRVPFFVNEGYGFGDVNRVWYPESTVPVRVISDDPAAMERLLNDPRFRSMIESGYLYKQHLTEEFEIAIAAVDDILAEIRTSLRQ